MRSVLTSRTEATASAFLVLTMALWAGNHVVGRWADGNIPPMTLAFFRWGGAALLILPFAWRDLKADWPVIRANLPLMLLLSVIGSGLYNTIQYIALTETTATSAGIFNSWNPVLVAAFGAILFGERLSARQIIGLATSLVGVMTIVLHGDLSSFSTLTFNRGDLIMLFAIAMWALYTALLRVRPAISTMAFSAFTFSVAGLINLPLAAYEYSQGLEVIWSWKAVAASIYVSVFAGVIGYVLFTRSVEIIGSTRTGVFSHLIPLFVAAMAVVVLGEEPRLFHAAGFALILAGVYLASRTPSPQVSDT